MSTLEDLNQALQKAAISERLVFEVLLSKVASVEGVSNINAKLLLDQLEKVHGHLSNVKLIIDLYENLEVQGFKQEKNSIEDFKKALLELSKQVNKDVQALNLKR